MDGAMVMRGARPPIASRSPGVDYRHRCAWPLPAAAAVGLWLLSSYISVVNCLREELAKIVKGLPRDKSSSNN